MKTNKQTISNETIERRAYELWQSAGSPDRREDEFWLLAEKELLAGPNGSTGTTTGKSTTKKAAAKDRNKS